MKYETVNLDTWKRGNLFRFYIDNLRNVMSMTVDIDVSSLITFARTHELKFYPAMMWVVSKAVNQRAEFRYDWIITEILFIGTTSHLTMRTSTKTTNNL